MKHSFLYQILHNLTIKANASKPEKQGYKWYKCVYTFNWMCQPKVEYCYAEIPEELLGSNITLINIAKHDKF